MITIDPKRTVDATLFDWKSNDYPEYGQPGQSCRHTDDCFIFACPGCGRFGGITCGNPKPDNRNGATWLIASGELSYPTKLTLSPSINCTGCCGWHGHLVDGKYNPC